MRIQFAALSLSLSLLLTAAANAPVFAQGTSPFWYLYMGQSLLYPLTRTVGLGGAFRYGPYNANPFYSTGSYVRNLNSKAIQWPYVYPYANSSFGPWGYRNAGMMPGTTGNANNDNTQTFSAGDEPDSANPAANTMNSANPYAGLGQGQNPQQSAAAVQAVPTSGGAPTMQNGSSLPSWSPPASAPPVASAVAASAPPVAPPFVPAPSAAAASPASTNSAAAGLGRPLAEGFINHLNTNYQGDMSKALGNNDTRSWARAMGVIDGNIEDGSHLSGDRVEVIGRVLKDNTLDPLSKLDTMRILLKKNPEPAK